MKFDRIHKVVTEKVEKLNNYQDNRLIAECNGYIECLDDIATSNELSSIERKIISAEMYRLQTAMINSVCRDKHTIRLEY